MATKFQQRFIAATACSSARKEIFMMQTVKKTQQLESLAAIKELKDLQVIDIPAKNKLLSYLKNGDVANFNATLTAVGLGATSTAMEIIEKAKI